MSSVMRFDEWQDSNGVPVLDGSGGGLQLGKILQVVSTTKTDTFTTSSTTFVDVTGLTVSITPTSDSSKILVLGRVALSSNSNGTANGRVVRNSTAIGNGTAAGSRPAASFVYRGGGGDGVPVNSFVHLDEPATTSALTYKVQVFVENTYTAAINFGRQDDPDASLSGRVASTITVMEVAG